ncbi:MAG: radical SAM protein [Deltaproteobacteria bacterium]|nr:radical SAM protein [Deltaproteobacteria bacterium]
MTTPAFPPGGLPERIIVEVTTKCNLRCTSCAITLYDFHGQHLPWAVFERVLPLLPHAKEVTLFGWGEPLLHPRFLDMFRAVKAYPHLRTYFVTNGMLLDRVAEVLVREGLTYLGISVDGATPATFEAIRQGGRLKKILANLRLLNDLKRQHGSVEPRTRFVFVAMRQNIEELPLLVDVAADHEVSEVKVNYLTVYREEDVGQSLWHHQALCAEQFEAAATRAAQRGVLLTLPPLIGQDQGAEGFHKDCHLPWTELFLGSDGLVRPCMINTETLGDARTQDLATLWRDAKYQWFREVVNSAGPPRECATCYQARFSNVNRYEAHVQLGAHVPMTTGLLPPEQITHTGEALRRAQAGR